MIYLLDTVAASEFEKPLLNQGFRQFFQSVPGDSIRISVVTLGELNYGLERLPPGRRRNQIADWLEIFEDRFRDRTILIDEPIARTWGALRVTVQRSGFNIAFDDLLIAATALHHDLTVVTRNVKDFTPTGCKILNPWDTELE